MFYKRINQTIISGTKSLALHSNLKGIFFISICKILKLNIKMHMLWNQSITLYICSTISFKYPIKCDITFIYFHFFLNDQSKVILHQYIFFFKCQINFFSYITHVAFWANETGAKKFCWIHITDELIQTTVHSHKWKEYHSGFLNKNMTTTKQNIYHFSRNNHGDSHEFIKQYKVPEFLYTSPVLI